MADSIFSQAGFDLPTSQPASNASAAAPGSIFESAGFALPGKEVKKAEPTWQEREADENLAALGVRAPVEPPKPPGQGRGVVQAIKDYPGVLVNRLIDTLKYPGDVMQGNKPVTIEDTLGLAGLAYGGGVGKTAGTAVATKMMPSTRAVNSLVEAIGPENVPELVAGMRANPRMTPADLSDPVRVTTQGLMAGGTPDVQSLISKAVRERSGSRLEATNSAYMEAMGPAPDVQKMIAGLKERSLMTTPSSDARAVLDDVLGRSIDPHSALQKMLVEREASNPLYEKALSRPVAWDERLQQFIDDPIVKSGIAKGTRIQRLESLAENKPFNPTDYAIKSFDEAGNPVLGETPNMRTLNVVKKGLDAMVEDAKDPVTGRLSEEGRAIDKVRKSFLSKLDDVNPDYKSAREAWAGPTKVQEAYDRGLNIFQNRVGSSGVNSTPEALASWVGNATKSEQDAVRLGARAAFEQHMRAGSDPATKAASLANKEVNQSKLATIFGKESADKLVQRLNFEHEDPIGKAFEAGFDTLKNRSGLSGATEDTPQAFREWLKTASPEEVVARRLGTRADIDQKINGVKNGALAGQNITQIPYNKEKLTALFGDKEASRLIRVMEDAHREAQTNAAILSGSKTAETEGAKARIKVRDVGGGNPLQYVAPIAAELLGQSAGVPFVGLGGSMLAKGAHMGVQKLGKMSDIARNMEFARNALAAGPAREETIRSLLTHPKVVREFKKRQNALAAP